MQDKNRGFGSLFFDVFRHTPQLRFGSVDIASLVDGNPNRFIPPRHVTIANETSQLDAAGPYNVRGFGYQGRDVAYAQVTVNLSALAADAVNQKIRKEQLLEH